jgi:dipeptidase D
MSEAIEGLKPELFWRYFAEISRIPRPSRHEERIARYVLNTAEELGLAAQKDNCGNVVVRKPASPGREGVRSICLQSHLDMVCEKNADKVHDFLKDPIELVRRGEVMTANGTTLGADNGVGVATSLAIMADRSLVHGPLELLFTIEEEIGLTGALNLSPDLLQSRMLLNLDSEEEGALYVGCAGGKDTFARWSLKRESAPERSRALALSVKGLKGGHSGLEIDKGLGNAIKILNRALLPLAKIGARVCSLNGGNMRNAIPRECEARLYLPLENLEQARALVLELNATFKAEYSSIDPDLVLSLTEIDGAPAEAVLAKADQQRICQTIAALPSGVQQMSADIPGLVEISTNVSVIATTPGDISLITSQRGSVASRLTEIVQTVEAIFELGGAKIEISAGYPGWKPNLKSPILQVAKECYRSLYAKDVAVKAIHAGLECGIIGERIPGMDMISFGPTLESVHSPDEKIYLDSVGKFWDFLVQILRSVE